MKLKAKITQKKGIVSAICLLLVAVIASVTALYAWFVSPSRAATKNVKLTVKGENVSLGDEITLSRTLGGIAQNETYTAENGVYYLLKDGAKQRLALRAVAEGERLTVALSFKNDEGFDKFSVYFAQTTGDTFPHGESTYSVLGALKYYDNAAGGFVWLAQYGSETAPSRTERTVVQTGLYSAAEKDENGFVRVEIVFEVDFSQLEGLGVGVESLWGLGVNIGSIGVAGERAGENI